MIRTEQMYTLYLIGVYTIGAVLATLQGQDNTADQMISEVQSIFDKSVDDQYAPYDDFDAGRAGLIYAASFLNKFYGRNVIDSSSVTAVGEAIIRRGQVVSSHPDEYLEWISPNDGETWLGQSHGSAGVLCQLLDVPELLVEGSESRRLIEGTLNHIVENQFPSGNFPSEYYEDDEDVLVQWDHGAPGVMGVLAKAWIQFENSSYLESVKLAADCTWERGLLNKGLQLCHGITGNTYMQIYVHKLTKDDKYMYRALSFQEFISKDPYLTGVNLMRQPTPTPYGFYGGSWESAIMLWIDLLAVQDNDFSSVYMPGYEPHL